MAKTISIKIQTTADLKGVQDIQRALQGIAQAQKAGGSGNSGAAKAIQLTGQAAQQAEKDVLRYASAMASAQRATGDNAGAVQTMRSALSQMTPNTIEAHQATTRLAQAQNTLQKELKGGASFAQQFGQSLTSSLTSIIGPAAAAGAAIAAISKGGELIQLGAQAEQTRLRFDGLAAAAGTTGNALLAALRSASAGTISDLNLELAANRAQLLGVADSAEKFSTLMEIARDRAQDMGISTTQAFNDLVTGLGRGSALILDNLGITVSVTEANKAYAAQIGKTVAQLTEAEQKQALINAVLVQGKASLQAAGGAAETTATKLERLNANLDNIKANLGSFTAEALGPAIEGLSRLTSADFDAMAGSLDNLGVVGKSALGGITGAFPSLGAGLDYIRGRASEASVEIVNLGDFATASGNAAGATRDDYYALGEAQIQAANAAAMHQAALMDDRAEMVQASLEAGALSVATKDATLASMEDTAAKEEQTAKTELLKARTEEAISAFMLLHPNISASGVASLAAAGQIDPLLAQLIQARIRANEATAALAAFNAQAGIRAAARGTGIATRAAADELKLEGIRARNTANQAAATKRYNDMLDAQHDRINAVGTADQRVALAEQNLATARAKYGANSAEAYRAETALMQARERTAKAGGGGGRAGGGGAARVSAAEQTTTRLQDIERQGGDKIAEINEQTQEKIAAIDKKYAEQRAREARELAEDIARTNASTLLDQQLNDFDKFQKNLSDEQKAALADREKAEAEYNAKVAQYQEEAKQQAASGDAQLAQDTLAARTKQAQAEKEIAERAAEAKRNAGKGQAAAVDAEAAEAVAAAKQQADTEIAIAQAKAAERAGAEQAEKDAVIAQAEEQKNKIVAAAEEQASKVKGASDAQKAAVISSLRAQADAAKTWADTIEGAAKRAQQAMDGVSGPPASEGDTEEGATAAGGGQGVRAGGQGIRASGGGRSAISSSAGGGDIISTIQDVVNFLSVLLPTIVAHNKLIKEVRTYEHALQNTVDVIGRVVELRKTLAQPIPALRPEVIIQLAEDAKTITTIVAQHIDPAAAKNKRLFEHILAADKAAIDILQTIANLRSQLAGVAATPIDVNLVRKLAAEAIAVVDIVKSEIIVANRAQSKALEEWAKVVEGSVGIIADVADLRKELSDQDNASPLDMDLVRGLAQRAKEIATIVQGELVPFSEQQSQGLQNYGAAVSASVGALKDVADLRKELSEQKDVSPFDVELIKGLAMRAKQITEIVQAQLIPVSEEQATAMQQYADTTGAAVGILKDTADLRKDLTEGEGVGLPVAMIQALADEARRVAEIVTKEMTPFSEEQVAAAQHFADTQGAAVSVLKDTADLRKELSDGQIGALDMRMVRALAADSRQIAQVVISEVVPIAEETVEAIQRYADTTGAAVGILKDTADLRRDFAESTGTPVDVRAIEKLADDAKRITQIVVSRMVPVSEEQATAAQRYADATGSAVSVIKDTLGLTATMFTDYQSPSDAQIGMVVKDAKRLVDSVAKAASVYKTEGLEAAKLFGEAAGSVLSAFKEQLLFAQALQSGDFVVNPANLAKFEQGMGATIATAGRLGAQAAAIPPANIAALQAVAAANTAAYDSMIKLAAVPFGNLPQAAGNFAGQSGSVGGPVTINVYPQPGQDPNTIANIVYQKLNQRIGAHR